MSIIINKKVEKLLKIFSLWLLFFVVSCGPKKDMIYMDKVDYNQEIQQAKYNGSLIQVGDELNIQITGYDELAIKPFNINTISNNNATDGSGATSVQSYIVNKEGGITMPVLGNIPVTGMTIDDLKVNLENRLKKYLIEPIVIIKPMNLKLVFLGEFGTKGMKTHDNDKLNILQAIALGGGTSENADLKNIRLIRNVNGVDETYVLDVTDYAITKSPYYYLQNNDILYAVPNKNAQILANKSAYWAKGVAAFGFLLTIYTLFFRK